LRKFCDPNIKISALVKLGRISKGREFLEEKAVMRANEPLLEFVF
jgi:hypothetical protein